jgi:hypothetical protein
MLTGQTGISVWKEKGDKMNRTGDTWHKQSGQPRGHLREEPTSRASGTLFQDGFFKLVSLQHQEGPLAYLNNNLYFPRNQLSVAELHLSNHLLFDCADVLCSRDPATRSRVKRASARLKSSSNPVAGHGIRGEKPFFSSLWSG